MSEGGAGVKAVSESASRPDATEPAALDLGAGAGALSAATDSGAGAGAASSSAVPNMLQAVRRSVKAGRSWLCRRMG